MTPERFRTLLEAYGTDFQRWPQAERESARVLATQSLPELREQTANAALLDGWLNSHTLTAADETLARRIAATAPVAPITQATPWWRLSWGMPWLWPGAGLAGIGLAGTLAGAFVVSVALRGAGPNAGDWPERGTAFSELSADWSEE
ncbi:MAG: hypothetical protein ABI907_04215 [Ramlibacter sp.]